MAIPLNYILSLLTRALQNNLIITKLVYFTLSIVLAIIRIIDYILTKGHKYFKKSIKKLNKELHNYEDKNLHLFIDILKEQVHFSRKLAAERPCKEGATLSD